MSFTVHTQEDDGPAVTAPPDECKKDYQNALRRNLKTWAAWRADANDILAAGGTLEDVRPLEHYLVHTAHPTENPRTLLAYSASKDSFSKLRKDTFLYFGIPRIKNSPAPTLPSSSAAAARRPPPPRSEPGRPASPPDLYALGGHANTTYGGHASRDAAQMSHELARLSVDPAQHPAYTSQAQQAFRSPSPVFTGSRDPNYASRDPNYASHDPNYASHDPNYHVGSYGGSPVLSRKSYYGSHESLGYGLPPPEVGFTPEFLASRKRNTYHGSFRAADPPPNYPY